MEYTYIYIGNGKQFSTASSMPFIASHKACRAVPTDHITEHYSIVADFIHDLNLPEGYWSKATHNVVDSTTLMELIHYK